MKRILNVALAGFAAIALTASLGGIGPAFAKEKTVTVGGAPMYPRRTSSRTPSTPRITPRWSPP